jgi:hypothetical protein
MRKANLMIVATIAATLVSAYSINGAPILGNLPQQTWDAGTNGWGTYTPYGTGIAVSHNIGGQYLELTVSGGAGPGFGVVAGTGDANFIGNFATLGAPTPDLQVRFDFITTGSTPNALGLYFMSSSGRLWGYDLLSQITPPSSGSTQYSIPIGAFEGWEGQNGTYVGSQFYADLADVTWLGLFIEAAAAGTEVYGLDDMYVTLIVPEPETVWMILAIVLSLAITFRSRLVDTVGQLKARYIKA